MGINCVFDNAKDRQIYLKDISCTAAIQPQRAAEKSSADKLSLLLLTSSQLGRPIWKQQTKSAASSLILCQTSRRGKKNSTSES